MKHKQNGLNLQNFSTTAYTRQTNRNTLIAFYKLEEARFRKELPINDEGFVVNEASVDVEEYDLLERDYPTQQEKPKQNSWGIVNEDS